MATPRAKGDGGGRPISRASESREAARAYVSNQWGDRGFECSEEVLRTRGYEGMMRSISDGAALRPSAARELRELLSDRTFRSKLNELLRVAGRVGRPLRSERLVLRDALQAFTSRTTEISLTSSCVGGVDDFRAMSTALAAYEAAPSRATRKRLDDLAEKPHILERAELVTAVSRALGQLGQRTDQKPATWAHWAIAVGLELPCDSATLERERRKPWERALKAARFPGQAPAAKRAASA